MIEIINQVFAIESKANKLDNNTFKRNLERLYFEFDALGYQIINPIGEKYKSERTDIEANITGDNNLIIKVIKPIIYFKEDNLSKLLQKGIVIVD